MNRTTSVQSKGYTVKGEQYEGDLKDVETNHAANVHAANEEDSKRKGVVTESNTSRDKERRL